MDSFARTVCCVIVVRAGLSLVNVGLPSASGIDAPVASTANRRPGVTSTQVTAAAVMSGVRYTPALPTTYTTRASAGSATTWKMVRRWKIGTLSTGVPAAVPIGRTDGRSPTPDSPVNAPYTAGAVTPGGSGSEPADTRVPRVVWPGGGSTTANSGEPDGLAAVGATAGVNRTFAGSTVTRPRIRVARNSPLSLATTR